MNGEREWNRGRMRSKDKRAAVETKTKCVGGNLVEYSTRASTVGNFLAV